MTPVVAVLSGADALPETLAELVPGRLSTVPSCPDGRSMSYRADGREFVLSCPIPIIARRIYDSKTRDFRTESD